MLAESHGVVIGHGALIREAADVIEVLLGGEGPIGGVRVGRGVGKARIARVTESLLIYGVTESLLIDMGCVTCLIFAYSRTIVQEVPVPSTEVPRMRNATTNRA